MAERIVPYREPETKFDKTLLYLRHYGLVATIKRVSEKLSKKDEGKERYQKFLEKNALTEEVLQAQRDTVFLYEPKFSIAVPMYMTQKNFLMELLESVAAQTYSSWELVLADASPDDYLGELVSTFTRSKGLTEKIKYVHLPENKGIAGNTNEAIERCSGDYLALLDHDDTLTPDALYEMAYAINQNEAFDCLYSDEDTLIWDTGVYYNPHFKPDYSPNLLYHHNYITHLFVCRMELAREIGGERGEFDGAQDHDFILRATEKARSVWHVRKVLYHWRAHPESTAMDMDSKTYAFEAGRKAVEDHFKRTGLEVKVELDNHAGFYKPCYEVDRKFSYTKIVINDGNGGYKTTAQLNKEALKATSHFILFVDEDVLPVDATSMILLQGNMALKDVAVAGPKMFFGNNTISHAGLVLGLNGFAGCPFYKMGREQAGYFFLNNTTHEVSAVSLDCMMVDQFALTEVGGFDERFTPHAAAVDLCIRLRGIGKSTIFNAESLWYYLKNKDTSVIDVTEEDKAYYEKKWRYGIAESDPFYNPNLTLTGRGYIL